MNQNFVSKARHGGTAAWFFETDALTEWKASGSLLWVYGKRMFFQITDGCLAVMTTCLSCSWGRKKYTSVCHDVMSLFEVIHGSL
jgi:hypothetical protein